MGDISRTCERLARNGEYTQQSLKVWAPGPLYTVLVRRGWRKEIVRVEPAHNAVVYRMIPPDYRMEGGAP